MTNNTSYMFDTTAFNSIVKGKVPVELLAGYKIYATHIQWDELNDTKKPELKAALTKGYVDINPISVPTESAVWDISKWDEAKWTADDVCEQITSDLDKLKRHRNNKKDALIAETAIKRDFTLITDDKNLNKVTHKHGGTCIYFEEFLENNI